MAIENLFLLLAVIMVGTYFQTVTGFGLGIIAIGAATAFELTTVAIMAAVVSLVTLANCAFALPGATRKLDWKAVRAVVIGVLPGVVVGVMLLEFLSYSAASALQCLVGIMIVYSGVNFMLRPAQQSERSGDTSFFVSGFGSGLTGGLFGMAGPPLVYQFYRQPFDIGIIRNMLLVVFACTSASRSMFIGVQGQLSQEILILTAVALPVVTITTFLGRRFPPPFSATTMRRAVFSLLMVIGVYLIVTAIMGMVA
ncbi:sulfite exporter TauE/SafE family protein [Photobacterium sanctipauli]|uniref:Probable membrane transporter protein n=1 Tax=Photobacterium sanctipauli TaxID=1342794 RepID=A0A2T3NZQ5_9GAMM|nr:sulfite exporter TauE/SafE family protein [Photobacterium sanctipauli]PSW21730.1 sulfite exporter TauE/SafE family protein [Photobacterium sanctipauli]